MEAVQLNLIDQLNEISELECEYDRLSALIDRRDDQGVDTTDLCEEFQIVQRKLIELRGH